MPAEPTLFEPDVRTDALLSPCGRYRYWLTRTWGTAPPVCWLMLNPSTADATADDPTIRRCMGFARAWGHGGIRVVNLFALRATDPEAMRSAGAAAIAGPADDPPWPWYENANDGHIVARSDGLRLVAAWGVHGSHLGRDRAVMRLLGPRRRVECLGVTASGQPRHPLYLPASAAPVPFVLPPGKE